MNVLLTYGIPPHTVPLVREANCPCCCTAAAAVESRGACVRENCAIHFYGYLGFNRPLTAAAAAFRMMTLLLLCTCCVVL